MGKMGAFLTRCQLRSFLAHASSLRRAKRFPRIEWFFPSFASACRCSRRFQTPPATVSFTPPFLYDCRRREIRSLLSWVCAWVVVSHVLLFFCVQESLSLTFSPVPVEPSSFEGFRFEGLIGVVVVSIFNQPQIRPVRPKGLEPLAQHLLAFPALLVPPPRTRSPSQHSSVLCAPSRNPPRDRSR